MTKTNHGSPIPPPETWRPTHQDVMLYPKELKKYGRCSYHCEDCGCNVFKQVERDEYECNGCGTRYKGER